MNAAQRFRRAVRYDPNIKRNKAAVNSVSTSGMREKTSGQTKPENADKVFLFGPRESSKNPSNKKPERRLQKEMSPAKRLFPANNCVKKSSKASSLAQFLCLVLTKNGLF